MAEVFHAVFSQPLFNGLVFLYNTVAFHDLGVATILLTFVIRIILFPFFQKSAKQQVVVQIMQPQVKEIQKKHKKDKAKQTEEMLKLYKQYGVNPFSSFLFLLIQMPVLIALYRIFLHGLTADSMGMLYSFVHTPEIFTSSFLGLIDLHEKSIVIVVLAALGQYAQGRLALSARAKKKKEGSEGDTESKAEQIGKKMVFIGPLITLLVFSGLPAAVTLYWLVSSLFSIVQQAIVNKSVIRHHEKLEGIHNNAS